MSIWTHREKDKGYVIIRIDTENKDIEEEIFETKHEETAAKLEEIFAKIEHDFNKREYAASIELSAMSKMVEFYQKIIVDILEDKLSNIDNMYALKTMLKEIEQTLQKSIVAVEKAKEKQEVEKSN